MTNKQFRVNRYRRVAFSAYPAVLGIQGLVTAPFAVSFAAMHHCLTLLLTYAPAALHLYWTLAAGAAVFALLPVTFGASFRCQTTEQILTFITFTVTPEPPGPPSPHCLLC